MTTQPRQTTRHGRAVTVLAATVVLLVLGGILVVRMLGGGGPLTGELDHDFGTIDIEGEMGASTHTFVLTNATTEPVHIKDIKASCGCTATELERSVVPPGETVSIGAELTVRNSGRRSSVLRLLLGDGATQTLEVTGIGRRANPLAYRRGRIELLPGQRVEFTFFQERFGTDDEPPEPDAVATDGFTLEFLGWRRIAEHDAGDARPAMWRGRYAIEHTGESIPEDATVTLRSTRVDGEAVSLTIPVVARGKAPDRSRRIMPTPDATPEPESPADAAPDDPGASSPSTGTPPPDAAPGG